MTIKKCFPTSIYYDWIVPDVKKRKSFTQDCLKESYQLQEQDDEGWNWSEEHYPMGYTSYASIANLQERSSTFVKMKKYIDKHVKTFAESLDYDLSNGALEMTSCWINMNPPGATHSLHLHPMSTISGTFYLHMPKPVSCLKFEDPRLSKMMAAPPRKAESAQQPFMYFHPSTGKVVLFESWLRHEVECNQSQENRFSISFNYCLLYTSPSPRDQRGSRMPSSA